MNVPRSHLNDGHESVVLDRILHAAIGRVTGGSSPIGLSLAILDWAAHLAASPGRMTELMRCATLEALRGFDLTMNEMRAQKQPVLPEILRAPRGKNCLTPLGSGSLSPRNIFGMRR